MNSFDDVSRAVENIRRMQKALECSPALEAARRAQEILNNSQVSENILRMQKMLVRSPALEAARRAQEILNNSQVSENILRMQKMLVRSPVLEAARRVEQALGNSTLALHRAIRQLDFRVGHTWNRLATHAEDTREKARGRDLRGQRLRIVGQVATKWLARLASRRKVRRPVGSSLRGIAEFVFSEKSYEQIYDPLISDLRLEYFEALASNRRWKARWVRTRGYGGFLAAMLAHAGGSGGHLVVRVWRILWAVG